MLERWGRAESFYLGVIGGFTLLLIAVFLGLAAYQEGLEVLKIVREYEALLAILVAVAAASFTILAVSKQIESSFVIEKSRKRDKAIAAVAFLPGALSKYWRYNEDMFKFLGYILPADLNDEDISTGLAAKASEPRPKFPDEILPIFERCIEFSPKSSAHIIADLLAISQIQEARLSDIYDKMDKSPRVKDLIITRHNAESLICGVVEVGARINILYDYARRRVDDLAEGVNKAAISNAASILNVEDLTEKYVSKWVDGFTPQRSIFRKTTG